MPDEIKSPSSTPPEGERKASLEKPAVPGGVKVTASGSVQSDPKSAAETSSASSPVPPKPEPAPSATPPAKPAAAAKPPVPEPVLWDSPLIAKLKGAYGSGIEPLTYAGQN